MSDPFLVFFKQVVHLNLNLAILILLVWALLGRGRGYKTTLIAWSVLLVRVLAEPWLCPESVTVPAVDMAQPGFLSVGLGMGPRFETLQVLLGSGKTILSAGDLTVMALGSPISSALGFLLALALGASIAWRVFHLALSAGSGQGFVWSSRAATPHISGWLRPTVVIPLSTRELLSPPELEIVLAHEQTHLNYKDQWTFAILYLLRSLTVVVLPLHIVLNGIEQALERRCDQVTAKHFGRAAVARTLYKMAAYQGRELGFQPAFSASHIESRIRSLRPKYQLESRLVYLLALFLLGAVIF